MSNFRVRYQTFEFGETDIHVRILRDNQQFHDEGDVAQKLGISSATWPFFGVVWPSSLVLSHFLSDFNIQGKRILEVGCGIALASLILNSRNANITATDYHPEAEDFLNKNVILNEGKKIPFIRTGWEDAESSLGLFDLIVGSDLLYERGHSEQLALFIRQHSRPNCQVILTDPVRGHHSRFSKNMEKLGYDYQKEKVISTSYLTEPYKGNLLFYRLL